MKSTQHLCSRPKSMQQIFSKITDSLQAGKAPKRVTDSFTLSALLDWALTYLLSATAQFANGIQAAADNFWHTCFCLPSLLLLFLTSASA